MKSYEGELWLTATQTIEFFLENSEVDMAIKFAKETVKDW